MRFKLEQLSAKGPLSFTYCRPQNKTQIADVDREFFSFNDFGVVVSDGYHVSGLRSIRLPRVYMRGWLTLFCVFPQVLLGSGYSD